MEHNITVEHYGIRIRPVTLDDAEFIHQLRCNRELSKYIGEIDDRFTVHLAWLKQYFERNNDYYFMIELRSGKPIGTIAIYDVNEGIGDWGRWVILPSIPAAAASSWLIYHVAFDILQLQSVYSSTVLANTHTVSFHDSCGLKRTRIEPKAITIRGIAYDLVVHTAERSNWGLLQKKLEGPAKLAERLMQGYLKKTIDIRRH